MDEIIPQLTGIDLVFLCNPNNPTGTFLHKEEILILVREIQRRKIFLVLDEAFIDLHEEESFIKEVKNYDHLIILRSLTKFFSLPGLRIGFGVGSSKLIKELEIQKIPWSVNYLAQIAVREVLRDEKFISPPLILYLLNCWAIFLLKCFRISWLRMEYLFEIVVILED